MRWEGRFGGIRIRGNRVRSPISEPLVKSVSARAIAGAGSREPSGVNSLQHLGKWGTAGDLSRRILAGGNPKCSNLRGGDLCWFADFNTAD